MNRQFRQIELSGEKKRIREILLGRVDRELNTLDWYARKMMRALHPDDRRHGAGESILAEIAALHESITDVQSRTHASVELSGFRTGPCCPAAEA